MPTSSRRGIRRNWASNTSRTICRSWTSSFCEADFGCGPSWRRRWAPHRRSSNDRTDRTDRSDEGTGRRMNNQQTPDENRPPLFAPRAIGVAKTPYHRTADVPKGPGTKHEANGTLEILPELEPGLIDIEGFSHLFVIWMFDRSQGFELLGP